jgi:hypothetical protein
MRSEMGSCKGSDGVKGGKGQTWYKVRDAEGSAAVPGLLVCGACYEDHIFISPSFSSKFEPVPPGLYKADDIWACDFALPYVKKVFEENSKTSNWQGFLPEVRARLGFPKCPGPNKGTTYQTAWFVPRDGPKGLMLCTACYCDQVIHSGEEDRWGQATEFIGQKAQVRCAMGNVGMKICMAQAQEEKNLKIVWDALQKLTADTPADQPSLLQEELCKSEGEKDGVWYTLKNNPDQFGICKACYILMAEPRLMEALDRQWKGVLPLAATLSVWLAVWAWPGDVYERLPGELSWWYLGFWTGFALCSWSWLAVILGGARVHLLREGPALRWAVPLVYPFYIFHQTVIVVVGFHLVGLPLGVHTRFLLIMLVSFAGTLLALEVVRRIPLVRDLFGLQPRLRRLGI